MILLNYSALGTILLFAHLIMHTKCQTQVGTAGRQNYWNLPKIALGPQACHKGCARPSTWEPSDFQNSLIADNMIHKA